MMTIETRVLIATSGPEDSASVADLVKKAVYIDIKKVDVESARDWEGEPSTTRLASDMLPMDGEFLIASLGLHYFQYSKSQDDEGNTVYELRAKKNYLQRRKLSELEYKRETEGDWSRAFPSVKNPASNEVQKVYDEFWKPILEPLGVLDYEQMKKELSDFHIVMTEASRVYYEITNGKLSKATTAAEHIIQEHQDRIDEAVAEALRKHSDIEKAYIKSEITDLN